ncbi:MAG: N-acetyltransferase [Rhodoglobus sp.]
MQARLATAADTDEVVQTLAEAFYNDPVWGWAFDDDDRRLAQHSAWFTLAVTSGVGNQSVWTTPGHEAVSVWVPPGCDEFSPADEAAFVPTLEAVVGARMTLLTDVFHCFELARPQEEHHYLSLLAASPRHRGEGHGMRLLAENLAQIDAVGGPAYLESTNPANLKRYESVGFEVSGSFDLPEGGPTVTTMWRAAR